ncbi:MAG: class I SAM-dependent methyltransferase [Thermodesulfovibrionales bacterium]
MVRSSPVLAENRLNTLYSDSCFIFSEEAPYAAQTYIDLLKNLVGRFGGPSGIDSLLEIGCSTGFFLDKAVQMGISNVQGFEPSRNCYEHAAENIKSLIVNDVFRPELLRDRMFDLVCSFHVIDHLPDPARVLASAAERLHPGGYMLLVSHDVESIGAKILRDFNPIFDVEHIYLFSQKTIARLLENIGLTILDVGSLANTYPLGYWVRMFPGLNKVLPLLPTGLRNLPISLKAGNLYAFARKD